MNFHLLLPSVLKVGTIPDLCNTKYHWYQHMGCGFLFWVLVVRRFGSLVINPSAKVMLRVDREYLEEWWGTDPVSHPRPALPWERLCSEKPSSEA